MHKGPLLWIGNVLAKDFMGDRWYISSAKSQEAKHL
jgi:hypothetical protein